MNIAIPSSLREEHDALHATLVRATREPGEVGEAAREVAKRLHAHFVREEELAMPPLGLLEELAKGRVDPSMREVVKLTERLRAELPSMLAEHGRIVEALSVLREAASRAGLTEFAQFADALTHHALNEEQVLYPAALLVGDYLKLALAREKAPG